MEDERIRRNIRLPASLVARADEEAAKTGLSYNEIVEAAMGYYLTRNDGAKELWVGRFQRLNDSLQNEEARVRGLTMMLMYLVQTFFYVHPEIKDGYEDSVAYSEASRMCKEWFERFAASPRQPDFEKDLRDALDRSAEKGAGKENAQK